MAACDAESCVDPARRPLTLIGLPEVSTLWYSQNRSIEVSVPAVSCQPAAEISVETWQLMYATWLAGYVPTSMRASTPPVSPASAVILESTKTYPYVEAGLRA